MPETPVVPFLPRSALFIRGMVAQCPPLAAVVAFASKEETVPPSRRHVIVEKLLRALPALPRPLDAASMESLSGLGPERLDALVAAQKGSGADALRKAWEPVVSALDEEAERAFARRCGTLLIELFRRRVIVSGRKSAVFRKNA